MNIDHQLLLRVYFFMPPALWELYHFLRMESIKKNADSLKKFYEDLLQRFIDRLHEENKYNHRGILTQTKIGLLQKTIKRKFLQGDELFTKTVQMKEGSRNFQFPKKQENISVVSEKVSLETEGENVKVQEKQKSQKQVNKNEQQNQEQDDLDFFNQSEGQEPKQQKQELNVQKTQQKSLNETQKQNTEQIEYKEVKAEDQLHLKNNETENNDECSSDNDFVENAEQNLNSAILGIFLAHHVKRRPKEETISLEMQNVFMKFPETGLEIFFPKVSYELKKEEIENIVKNQKDKSSN